MGGRRDVDVAANSINTITSIIHKQAMVTNKYFNYPCSNGTPFEFQLPG